MATPNDQRFRLPSLNQAPCDVWSTREKLALATSVEKSGDQNWNSVSRSLKSFFPEDHRPDDWFHYKLCALQYRDMLDKTECPKRKREKKERSEETPQMIIVRNLTTERISELKKSIPDKIAKLCELKANLEQLKSEHCNEEFLSKLSSYVREKMRLENQELLEDQKWRLDRQPKVLQLLRRHPKPLIKSPALTVPIPESISDNESKSGSFDTSITSKRDSKEIIPEKDTSVLSSLLHPASQPGLKSPRSVHENNQFDESKADSRMNENLLSSDAKGDIVDSNAEIKNPLASGTSASQEKESVKNEIILEQENSNDTIEETFESGSGTKDDTNWSMENKTDSTKSTSKDSSETLPAKSDETTIKDIKVEEESSLVVDSKGSLLNEPDDSTLASPKEKMRRKRRRFNKIVNATVMQTRSTRSQSNIKTEEPKDLHTKAETSKSKKRSNSVDESTSVDNTISEESNDGKSSTTESTQNDDVVDRKVRKSLNFKLSNISSHRHAHYFNRTQSENYRRIVYQPLTLTTIKQRIQNGQIKSDLELKRDLMLMFSNSLNWNGRHERIHKSTLEMIADTIKMFDSFNQKAPRTRERAAQTPEVKAKVGRRKTRGSISLDKLAKKKS